MTNPPEVESVLDEIRQQLALMPLEEFNDHFFGGLQWIYETPDTAEQDRSAPVCRTARELAGALVFATRTGRPLNQSNVRRDIWTKLVRRADVRALDLYSLRHTFASLGRVAGESAFNVARAMGHSRSTPVDQVYAHSLQSGMASVAERVTARALGEQPKLRVIEGGQRDVRQTLDESPVEGVMNRATA